MQCNDPSVLLPVLPKSQLREKLCCRVEGAGVVKGARDSVPPFTRSRDWPRSCQRLSSGALSRASASPSACRASHSFHSCATRAVTRASQHLGGAKKGAYDVLLLRDGASAARAVSCCVLALALASYLRCERVDPPRL